MRCASCDRAYLVAEIDEGQCRQCRDECTIARLAAEIHRLKTERGEWADALAAVAGVCDDAINERDRLAKLNGRRERRILRARHQEEGYPCTPEWISSIERLYTDATVTQRVCSALRRAWAELVELRRVAGPRFDAIGPLAIEATDRGWDYEHMPLEDFWIGALRDAEAETLKGPTDGP